MGELKNDKATGVTNMKLENFSNLRQIDDKFIVYVKYQGNLNFLFDI